MSDEGGPEEMILRADPLCRRLAAQYVGPYLPYDDALQTARLAVLDALRTFDRCQGQWLSWAHAHARGAVSEALRRSRLIRLPRSAEERGEVAPRPSYDSCGDSMSPSPEAAYAAREELSLVLSTLDDRSVDIVLSHAEGETFGEIGERLGLSKQRVQILFHTALSKIEEEHDHN